MLLRVVLSFQLLRGQVSAVGTDVVLPTVDLLLETFLRFATQITKNGVSPKPLHRSWP
jgi:hypothetical protein